MKVSGNDSSTRVVCIRGLGGGIELGGSVQEVSAGRGRVGRPART